MPSEHEPGAPAAPTESAPAKSSWHAFAFIFATVALDMLALGVIVPVLPKLMIEMEGGDIAAAAGVTGVFGAAWAAMQFVFAPVLGILSDRFGRRPVILLSNLGLGLDYVFMAFAPTIPLLFIGRLISGITSSSFPTACAYIADVTEPDKRAQRFGFLNAAFGFGFVVGPAVGGFLGDIDLRLPFLVAAGLSLANFLYGVFVLPESLPKDKRAAFSWARANPVGSLRVLRSHPVLMGIAFASFLYFLAHEVLPSVFVLYTTHRYQWDSATIGAVLALVGVMSIAVSVGLTGVAVKRIGERASAMVGLLFGAVSFVIFGLAPLGWLFVAGIVVESIWGISGPAINSICSRLVSPSEQGQLQGATQSMRGITGMIGPLLFTQVFAQGIAHEDVDIPGAPWFLAGALLFCSVLVIARVTAREAPPTATAA